MELFDIAFGSFMWTISMTFLLSFAGNFDFIVFLGPVMCIFKYKSLP